MSCVLCRDKKVKAFSFFKNIIREFSESREFHDSVHFTYGRILSAKICRNNQQNVNEPLNYQNSISVQNTGNDDFFWKGQV